MRRCPSAPSTTPRPSSLVGDPSIALIERLRAMREQNRSCSSLPGRGTRPSSVASGRSHSAPTTPRRAGSTATTPRAVTPRGAHVSPSRARSVTSAVTPRGRAKSPSGKRDSGTAITPRGRARSCSGTPRSAAIGGAGIGGALQIHATMPDISSVTLMERLQAARLQQQRPPQTGLHPAGSVAGKSAGPIATGTSQPMELVATELKQRVRSDAIRPTAEHEESVVSRSVKDSSYGLRPAMPPPALESMALEQREEVDELLHVLTGGAC